MNLFPYQRDVTKYRFPLPNEIWTRKLKPPAFAVLAYLQYRHCRKFGGTVTPEELASIIQDIRSGNTGDLPVATQNPEEQEEMDDEE